jgi:[ribosomal protein S18]-alanine N-acetyltransferase
MRERSGFKSEEHDFERIHYMKMNSSHLESLIELERQCFSIPWTKKMFTEELENQRTFYCVAVYDDKVIGYAGMWVVLDEGQITNIAVHPSFRRRKIASYFLLTLIQYAKENGACQLTLEVRESNVLARLLYEKHGFYRVGTRRAYYQDNGEDACILLKNLFVDS